MPDAFTERARFDNILIYHDCLYLDHFARKLENLGFIRTVKATKPWINASDFSTARIGFPGPNTGIGFRFFIC